MKRLLWVALILVAVIALAVVYLIRGRPAPKAATLLPDSTLMFLDMPDFSRSRTEFQHTALYALAQEPEVQAFLVEPRRSFNEWLGYAKDTQDEDRIVEFVLNAIQGEAFVALTKVTVIPAFQARVVCGIDTRNKHLEARATLAYYERRLREQPGARLDNKKYLGVNYSVWELPSRRRVCHAFLNTMLVFTWGEDDLRDVITRFTGHAPRGSPSLAAAAHYQNALRHLPPAREFVAYANVEQVVNLVGPFLAFAPQTAGAFQKLSRIQSTALSFTFADRQIQDVGFTAYKSDATPPPVAQRKTLAVTSPQTSAYAVQSSDLGALYQQLMDSIAQSGNASLVSAAGQFDQQLRNGGVRVREELLSFIGPETALVVTWREGAPLPDAALVAEVRNAGQIRGRIDLALKALKEAALGTDAKFPVEEMPVLGETLHVARVPSGQIAPSYVTTDSFFILALTPDYARELLGQLKQSKPTLATSPAYQQAMKQLPDNASAYGYYDLSGLFRPLYSRLRPELARREAIPFLELNKLPQTETIARHLSPFASATVTEPRSRTTTAYSPIGKPLTFLIAGAGAIAVAQPYWSPYLSLINPVAPRTSSGTAVPPAPRGNRAAESQTPATR